MRPTVILLLLCGLATGTGYWVWQRHLEAVKNLGLAGNDPVAAATAATNEALAQSASADNAVKLRQLEDQNKLLKAENEKLRSAAMAGSTASTPQDPANDARVIEPSGKEVSVEKLVRDVEGIRGLSFKRPLTFTKLSSPDLEARMRAGWEALVPAGEREVRLRVARAFGFVRERFDLINALTGLAMEQHGGWYDDSTATLYYDDSWDLTGRPDLRSRIILEIARALLVQNFNLKPGPPFGGVNDDAALAAQAILSGDAALTKLKRFVNDQIQGDNNVTVPPSAPFYGAPPYLRHSFIFPYTMSEVFTERVQENAPPGSDDRLPLNKLFDRPPTSTAEVMHMELYFNEPMFVPTPLTFPTEEVNGTKALMTNTLGEFGVLLLLRSQIVQQDALSAANGWAGDRYQVYPGAADGADDYVWKTAWRSEGEAAEFAKVIRTVLLHQNAIPMKPSFEQPDGGLIVNDPQKILRVSMTADKKGVNVLNATRREVADALEKALLK